MLKVQYYMSLKKGGKEQVYKHPDDLLTKAFEYFAWCEDNPWYKKELMRSGDRKGETVEVPISRPYTLAGLCVYCGISESSFAQYAENEGMKTAHSHISEIILQNQLEGAILGAYNSSFVTRLLESADNETLSPTNGQPFIVNVINRETKDELEKLRDRLKQG